MYNGEIGTALELTIRDESGNLVDLSTLEELTFIIRKPDGAEVEKTPAVMSPGVAEYVTVSGDIDQIGGWKFRARLVSSTFDRKTSWAKFQVFE